MYAPYSVGTYYNNTFEYVLKLINKKYENKYRGSRENTYNKMIKDKFTFSRICGIDDIITVNYNSRLMGPYYKIVYNTKRPSHIRLIKNESNNIFNTQLYDALNKKKLC